MASDGFRTVRRLLGEIAIQNEWKISKTTFVNSFRIKKFQLQRPSCSRSGLPFLAILLALLTTIASVALKAQHTQAKTKRYKIGVVDLMILKRQKLGAFQLTKEIGADGVEVDMGGLGNRPTFENKLAEPATRKEFLDKAKELNIEICSIAMTGFYAQSFAKRPGVDKMVQDCLNTMAAMNVKVAFLPLGVQGDLVKNPELRPAIVERLRAAGKQAQAAGKIIGIETSLSAKEEVRLLNEIGSPAIKIYFNFANALEAGRDLYDELRILGKKRICQIHCTDKDGVWLQNNKRIDMPGVKKTLDKMGWTGWLVIERSRDATDPTNVKKNFSANTSFMKSVFQE